MKYSGKRLLMAPVMIPHGHSFLEEVYAKILPARGWEITWYVEEADAGEDFTEKDWNGTRVLSRAPVNVRYNPLEAARAKEHPLSKLLETREYDLFQVRNGWRTIRACRSAWRKMGVPLVFQKSFPTEDYHVEELKIRKPALKNFLLAKAFYEKKVAYREIARADWIFPISEYMKDDLAAQGLPPERMTPIPLGFNCDVRPEDIDAEDIRRRLGIGDRPSALYFGSMAAQRQLDVLIRAFARAAKNAPDATLVMLGGGKDLKRDVDHLKELARQTGFKDRIIFQPQVPRDEVFKFIRACDFTISPIPDVPLYRVSSPTKVVESLALGRAALVSRLPDQEKMIRDSGAGVCVDFNEDEFAKAMTRLFSQRGLCADLGSKGREYIEKHRDYNKIADTIEEVYERLLHAKSRG